MLELLVRVALKYSLKYTIEINIYINFDTSQRIIFVHLESMLKELAQKGRIKKFQKVRSSIL